MDDRELLREFVERRSDAAFAELVRRHVDLVYSTALRLVGGTETAKDVSQSVFIRLASKAGSVREGNALPGWLYRATRFEAADAIRREQRRHQQENEAVNLSELNADPSPEWNALAPQLEETMCQLHRVEQDALILRFFEKQPLAEVGRRLGLSEEAARKRVARALEKLRTRFARHGVKVASGTLASLLTAHTAAAAPTGLASSLAAASLAEAAGAGAAGVSTLLNLLFMTKTKTVLVFALIAAGLSLPIVSQHRQIARLRQEVVALRMEKAALKARLLTGDAETTAAVATSANPKVEMAQSPRLSSADVVARIAALLSERKPMDKARMEQWARLMGQIPPEEMDSALLAALQLPDFEIRTAIAQTIFHNWVEANPRAALAFAMVNFQGKEKSDAIRDALQRWAAKEPEAAFAAWREQAADPTKRLAWGGDQQQTVAALFAGVSQVDLQQAAAYLKGLDGDLFGSAMRGMAQTAGKTEAGRAFFLEQLKQVSDLPVSYETMSSFMSSWAQYDLPSAAAWVEQQPAGKQRDYAVREVGLNYVRRDPRTGATWWLAQATPEEQSQAYFGIAQHWAQQDIKTAGEWLNQQSNSPALDSARFAFADVAVKHDPVTALKWAESITEADFRNSVLVSTWQQWRRANAAAAEQFLARSGWSAEVVARARGKAASK
jgi:RNA polymerase sigma factor (sigma-70 family)